MQNNHQVYIINDSAYWRKRLVKYADRHNYSCYLDNRDYTKDPYSKYELLAGFGAKEILKIESHEIKINPETLIMRIKDFLQESTSFIFGAQSYDLKNLIEDLSSENIDHIDAPELLYFKPLIVISYEANKLFIQIDENVKDLTPDDVIKEIQNAYSDHSFGENRIEAIQSRIDKSTYINTISQLQQEITDGNIYEINYCHEFYSSPTKLNAVELFSNLSKASPTPFTSFVKLGDIYIISASPERFLTKRCRKLISQPIKGTIGRGKDQKEDDKLKEQLRINPKERSENIMIVDLVRNDLSRTAEKGSVEVKELCKIYSFPQVHQMISTVTSTLKDELTAFDAIFNAFPMGSMTGAPKIRAMQLIEKHEHTKRGLYSGCVGYFDPDGDFDLSVTIRSFIYNSAKQYLSFQVGGAITSRSDANSEYEETLLKAKALISTLNEMIAK